MRQLSALLLLLLCPPAFSTVSPVAQRTVWDRIMEEQSQLNLRRGYALLQSEDYAAAAKELSDAVAKNPRDPAARVLYGASLYWLGEPARALAAYDEAIALDPKDSTARQLRGIALAWQGDIKGALDSFLKADELDPSRADVKMNIGSVYQATGRYADALVYFRRSVKLDPGNPLYRFQLGLLYSRLGRYPEAGVEYSEAIRLFPAYEDAVLELAVVTEREGSVKEAVSLYRRALKLKPGDNVARFRLAAALLDLGRTQEAARAVLPALALSPANDRGGITLSLAYAGSPGETGGGGRGGAVAESLRAVPADQDIKLKAEFIELPKAEVQAPRAREGSMAAGLARAAARPRLGYSAREFLIPAGPGREERIAEAAAQIDKILESAKASSDVKVSVKMETAPAAGAKSSKGAEVLYRPRSVGNDMGLWIVGNNWMENVSEAVEDFDGSGGVPGAVEGLGWLLLGEAARAQEAFSRLGGELGLCRELGLTVALVERGDMAAARERAAAAAALSPDNGIAKENLKWLSGTKK